jgi:hypothetical protein
VGLRGGGVGGNNLVRDDETLDVASASESLRELLYVGKCELFTVGMNPAHSSDHRSATFKSIGIGNSTPVAGSRTGFAHVSRTRSFTLSASD